MGTVPPLFAHVIGAFDSVFISPLCANLLRKHWCVLRAQVSTADCRFIGWCRFSGPIIFAAKSEGNLRLYRFGTAVCTDGASRSSVV